MIEGNFWNDAFFKLNAQKYERMQLVKQCTTPREDFFVSLAYTLVNIYVKWMNIWQIYHRHLKGSSHAHLEPRV